MEELKNIINTELTDIKIALEFEFLDPNNINIGWFNDYYKEEAPFEEIYSRFLQHPRASRLNTQQAVFFYLYEKDKKSMFDEMYSVIGSTQTEQHAIDELANELENICNISIGRLNINSHPSESSTIDTWSLGYQKNLILRSPYMNNISALMNIHSIIDGLNSNHFISSGGAMRVYIRSTNPFPQLMWFKAMSLFDVDNVIYELMKFPLSQRHNEASKLTKAVPAETAKKFMVKFLSKIKRTEVEVSTSKIIVELDDSEKYLSDKETTITWFSRIILLMHVIMNKEVYKVEYVDKLKHILRRTGIKK